MDTKAKKRLEVINKKLQSLRPRLVGAKSQADDLDEIKQLEAEINALETEAEKLKSSR
jgi:archaellum component FlaC